MRRSNLYHLLIGGGIAIISLLITVMAPGVFGSVDQSIRSAQYHLRGESTIDSSIVILYLDNNAIASLGDLPLKRSYYALVVHTLHQLGVKAIGIDIAFTEPDKEYPEYDEVFSSVVRDAGNVILSVYFNSISDRPSLSSHVPDRLTYANPSRYRFLCGTQLMNPFDELLSGAAGVGHTNLTDDLAVPAFIAIDDSEGEHLTAAFPLEIWRASTWVERERIHLTGSGAMITMDYESLAIPYADRGEVMLNYAGGTSSLRMIPLVNLLQSYDTMLAGGVPSIPVQSLRGKIVIVGIVAQGRSSFIETPFSAQFPSLGVHAMFLHDLLRQSFLIRTPQVTEYVIVLVMALAVILLMGMRREMVGLISILGCAGGLIVISFIAFSLYSYVLPIAHVLFVMGSVGIGLFIYKHQVVKTAMDSVAEERDRIAITLQKKESTLRSLEEELTASRRQLLESKRTTLLDEIRRYKTEILRLQAQSDDVQLFVPERGNESVENFHGIVYSTSGPMGGVIAFIKKIATSNESVLLLGESGTGKELVAQALHVHSHRSKKPFIAVNCGALSETLLESELFGHEKGAFTGAVKDKPGRFELADGGTIFLDEIAETSEAFQVKLLRVVQEGGFERVGGTISQKVDVRVIAATNRDLKKTVEEKHFRKDLYYRLNVFTVQLPALRERRSDIPSLVDHFIAGESHEMRCSAAVMSILQQQAWPGNVRELQSVVKRAVLLARAEGRTILRAKDLPDELAATVGAFVDLEEQVIQSLQEKKFSRSAISETAHDLGGLNRGTVAEYFRGYCFKMFVEHKFSVKKTVSAIAAGADAAASKRVQKKLVEYLRNALELVDQKKPLEHIIEISRSKYKNLPQRYHATLDEIIRKYYLREWMIDKGMR